MKPDVNPMSRAGLLAAVLVVSMVVASCATVHAPGDPAAEAADAAAGGSGAPTPGAGAAGDPPATADTARAELATGIALYDKGAYIEAIRSLLTAQGIWHAPLETQVAARKYLAFSHCLLNRPKPCREQFRDLLRIKPDFELSTAEAGHPQWGAAFTEAKREAAAQPG